MFRVLRKYLTFSNTKHFESGCFYGYDKYNNDKQK